MIKALHEDPDFFREAVNFTARETAFLPRLIEKDYFCTVLLEYLAQNVDDLVFKGGTCLAKIHAHFYRLSEDLDFVLAMPTDSSRADRRMRVAPLKRALEKLPEDLPAFRFIEPLRGANNSTQYNATVAYQSLLIRQEDTVKIEVGLREPLLTATIDGQARTVLGDPLSGKQLVEPIAVRSISKREAFAEKFRAALSRLDPAIRDFFDLDYAVRRLDLPIEDGEFIGLIRQKLAVPGNPAVDVSEARLSALNRQIDPQLKPVLREQDFREFSLDRIFQVVQRMAAKTA